MLKSHSNYVVITHLINHIVVLTCMIMIKITFFKYIGWCLTFTFFDIIYLLWVVKSHLLIMLACSRLEWIFKLFECALWNIWLTKRQVTLLIYHWFNYFRAIIWLLIKFLLSFSFRIICNLRLRLFNNQIILSREFNWIFNFGHLLSNGFIESPLLLIE